MAKSSSDLYDLGDRPPVGEVPSRMHAFLVRQGPLRRTGEGVAAGSDSHAGARPAGRARLRHGDRHQLQQRVGRARLSRRRDRGPPEEGGARGLPRGRQRLLRHRVGGRRRGDDVEVGDEVVVHSGWWAPDDPWVLAGRDPMLAPSTRIWGYQTNYGSYCQFARAQSHQCQPKPRHLTGGGGCYLLCASTAYRMLMVVAERGRAGRSRAGLGRRRRPREHGARDRLRARGTGGGGGPDDEKRQFCLDHGAVGVIDRRNFDHFGPMPDTASPAYRDFIKGARAFGKAIWEVLASGRAPPSCSSTPGRALCPLRDSCAQPAA